MATFNANFKTLLSWELQIVHWIAMLCVALSVLFVLTPAAYHRQAEPGRVSRFLVKLASTFLALSMVPMMFGIVLDVYVISIALTGSVTAAVIASAALLIGFVLLWFIFPQSYRKNYAPVARR